MNAPFQSGLRAIALAVAAFALVACSGAEQRAQQHLEKGRAFMADGNYEKARLELKNATQIEPELVEAIYLMGQLMERMQSFRDAANGYRRVLELDPDHHEARVRLGHLYLLAGAFEEVRTLVEEGLARVPEHPGLLTLRGSVRARDGDQDGALADGLAAVRFGPDNVEAVGLLSALYRAMNRVEDAIDVLKDGIGRKPDYVPMRVVLASIHAERGDRGEAERLLRESIALEPDAFVHRARLATFYSDIRQPDRAEAVLHEAVAHAPKDIAPKLAVVEFMLRTKDIDAAEESLRRFIEEDPASLGLRTALAGLYETTNRLEQAQETYREIIALDRRGAEGIQARSKLAGLLWRTGRREDAEREIAAVLADNPRDNDALMLRAEMALQRNAPGDAIAALRTVIQDQPGLPPALKLLAQAHLMNNEPQLARDQLQQVVALAPRDRAARLQLAQIVAQIGEHDVAQRHLQEILGANPLDAEALEILFKVELARGDADAAQATAQRVREAYPDRALGYFLAGEALRARRDLAGAAREYESALAKSTPDAVLPLTALVAVLLERNLPAQAMDSIEEALRAAPQSALAHHLKGEVLMFGLKRYGDAIDEFERTLSLQPTYAVAYRNLALAHIANEDREAAIAVYRRGIEATGGSATLTAQLAALYEGFGHPDEAISLYQDLHRRQPDSTSIANNLAMLLATHRDDKASLDQAQQLAARLTGSDNPGYLDTRGWVSYRQGDLNTAVFLLEQAATRMPDNAVVRYHLGRVYHDRGDLELARRNLERALERPQPFAGRDHAHALLNTLGES